MSEFPMFWKKTQRYIIFCPVYLFFFYHCSFTLKDVKWPIAGLTLAVVFVGIAYVTNWIISIGIWLYKSLRDALVLYMETD
jgi:hypothetical protein